MDITFAIKFFGALFAIMNPLAGLPIFLGMTEDVGSAVQRKIALKMTFYIVVIGVVAALAGTQVLKFFGISIHDLQVAGGLVVLGLAFSWLLAPIALIPAGGMVFALGVRRRQRARQLQEWTREYRKTGTRPTAANAVRAP